MQRVTSSHFSYGTNSFENLSEITDEHGRIGQYGINGILFNVQDIRNTIRYNDEIKGDFGSKLAQLISSPNRLALLTSKNEGRDWTVVKLNDVFIAFCPGGKGSNSYQVFYKVNNEKFLELKSDKIEKHTCLSACAFVPVNVNAFYLSATTVDIWDFSIKEGSPPFGVAFGSDQLFVDKTKGQVYWKDCDTGAKHKMSTEDFSMLLNEMMEYACFRPDSSFRNLNGFRCDAPLLHYLKYKHGLTCKAFGNLPAALEFRQSVADLAQFKINLNTFFEDTKIERGNALSMDQIRQRFS